MNRPLLFRLFMLTLFLFGCEQYFGYNYDVTMPHNAISIFGTVENTFTSEKVDSALVEIGDQQTYTDAFGNFRIIHQIQTDDERNRPVSINVSAKDYFSYSGRFIIYHQDIRYDVALDYAAPILDSSFVSVVSGENRLMCHVFLHDYQGAFNVRLVRGSFFYEKEGEHVYRQSDIELSYHTDLSPIAAEFTGYVPKYLDQGWALISRGFFYYIYAEDYEGYSVRRRY